MMLYTESDKYLGHVVRAEVTAVATRLDMLDDWDKAIGKLPDAPQREAYADHFLRVRVRIERFIGGAYFSQPFVPPGMHVEKGDVIDQPINRATEAAQTFADRAYVLRIVCRSTDNACKASADGRRRGIVD